jgi:hypothetical protein
LSNKLLIDRNALLRQSVGDGLWPCVQAEVGEGVTDGPFVAGGAHITILLSGKPTCSPCFIAGAGLRYVEADQGSCTMSFANALNILRPTLPYYLALTKFRLLHIEKDRFEFRRFEIS